MIASKTGKTVNQWISEKTISEAKALLVNTSMTVKEISRYLGFSEATHFSSYFKKLVDLTPNTFRKQSTSS